MTKPPKLQPGQRLSTAQRDDIGADLLQRYKTGSSIRQICGQTGYSIGRVRRLLVEAGVQFRSRGGGNRTARQTSGRSSGSKR
jgi:hypothetical protein